MQIRPDQLAVVTGGGTAIGRALCRQLSAQGVHVATCDLIEANMAETLELCARAAPSGTRVTTYRADVSDEAQMLAFRDTVPACGARGSDRSDLGCVIRDSCGRSRVPSAFARANPAITRSRIMARSNSAKTPSI